MNKGQSGQIATPFPKKGEPVSVSVKRARREEGILLE